MNVEDGQGEANRLGFGLIWVRVEAQNKLDFGAEDLDSFGCFGRVHVTFGLYGCFGALIVLFSKQFKHREARMEEV